MAELTIAVTNPGTDHMGGECRIFTREVPDGFAWPLRQGDRIQCCRSDDGEWYADMDVHHVWRYADGTLHVELSKVYQDPGTKMQALISNTGERTDLTQWWTERDGLLPDLLLASGWTEWHPS